MWWIWLATAQAASFPTEHLVDLIGDTQRKVEAVLGRKLARTPTVKITVGPMAADEVRAALAADHPELGPEGLGRRYGEHLDEIRSSLAYYSGTVGKIYLLDDRLAAVFSRRKTPDELREGMLGCVVAHELVHAVQDEQGVLGLTRSDAGTALVEGQAAWVANQVCTGVTGRFARSVEGLDVIASMDANNPDVFHYAYGGKFVAAYVRHYGVEGLWWLMHQAEAPPRSAIVEVVQARIPQGWASAKALTEVYARDLDLDPANAVERLRSPEFLLPDTAVDEEGAPLRPIAGVQTYFRTNTRRAVAMSFLFDSSAGAEALVRARAEALRSFRVGTTVFTVAPFYDNHIKTLMPLVGPARPEGVTESIDMRVKIGGNEWYDEVWAARGPQVVGVTWEGRAPGRKLNRALRDLLDIEFPTEEPLLETNAPAHATLVRYAPPVEVARPWEDGPVGHDRDE